MALNANDENTAINLTNVVRSISHVLKQTDPEDVRFSVNNLAIKKFHK